MKKTYMQPRLRSIDEFDVAFAARLAFGDVKYMAPDGEAASTLASYLAALLPHAKIARFSVNFDTLPRTYEPMDLLVVGGDEVEQMRGFMKTNLPICRAVPRISLAMHLSRADCANLLRSGYDDVILVEQTEIEEAAARIVAVSNRYHAMKREMKSGRAASASLDHICSVDGLTAAQRRIFDKLYGSYGRTVPCEALRCAAATPDGSPSRDTLRVQLSKLRRHLKGGYFIESNYGEGYSLRHIANTAG